MDIKLITKAFPNMFALILFKIQITKGTDLNKRSIKVLCSIIVMYNHKRATSLSHTVVF